ncbi:MAG: alpha-ketoglutarate-dependent dioxygenase AlkB [Paracoccaceae bacterium]
MTPLTLRAVRIFKGYFNADQQADLVKEIRKVATKAPMFFPTTPSGKTMSVRMTSAGRYGWVSDRAGHRYSDTHPGGQAWPEIPDIVCDAWTDITGLDRAPDCCLINYYGEDARMGLHQDRDEASFDWPVLSISLGDEGLFRVGATTRGGKTDSVWLQSGDVVVLGDAARLAYHGVDRIRFGSSSLLPNAGRINLTLRVVD